MVAESISIGEGTLCAACNGPLRLDVRSPASTYARRGAYHVATCDRCGSGRTVPVPSSPELEAFYANEYKYDAHVLIAAEKRWRAGRILDDALPEGAKRVLDIGCMYGYLLEEARERGVEAVGVELSTGPAEAAAAKGFRVHHGMIEEFAANETEKYDLVVAQHVLEHIEAPEAFLRRVRELLAPGGKLCIVVPNYDSKVRKTFKHSWGWYQLPVHLHHFGHRGLETLFTRTGFGVVRHVQRGGDSLFMMTTLLQSIDKMPKSARAMGSSAASRAFFRTASAVLRPYYFVGDDELVYVATIR